jgi:outer membrane protein OmpA-like peptidoglycan-associated protein
MKSSALTLVGTVYFNNNEYFIDGTDIATIKGVAEQLKKTPYKEVLVKGNTDIKQGVDNVWLSKARAEAVANTLDKYLKVPNLIRAWYASSMPVAIGLDKASLAKNRRVEIYTLEEVYATAAPTPSPKANVSAGDLILNPVTFNRNEYFLSAQARKDLVADVQNLFKAGCRKVALVGTEDGTRGGLPNMGLLRAKAVRDFMKSLDPALTFDSLKKAISINREVRISCSQ